MTKNYYTRANCPNCPDNYNNGQIVEWRVGYELTGVPSKANNRPGRDGADVEGWQVKSPKASVIDGDKCDGYIFGFPTEDFFYTMSRMEFVEFLLDFSYIDRDSKTGKAKIRIKNDTKKMREWLEARA